jgi:hypothetical protein
MCKKSQYMRLIPWTHHRGSEHLLLQEATKWSFNEGINF